MAVLSHLAPQCVFQYFEKLCAVPHGSGNTKKISDLCAGFAQELGLRYRQDEANNLVIWKEGSPGYESAPVMILQGHMDMVCAKTEDCVKDMAAEGLDPVTDGEWVWAEKTTLGGDNGIAVAMILAILADDTLPHPPLEAVFTTDEETGMNGAKALDCSDLKGRQMLNLDSEREGIFTVSCAGGVRLECFLPGKPEPSEDRGYRVILSGLRGGHSGGEIHRGRGSANQLMGRVLYSAWERCPGLRLADIRGGRFDNVICPHNEALVTVPGDETTEFEAFLREFDGVLKNEYAAGDPGITLSWETAEVPAAFTAETTAHMLHVFLALPHGVEAMSQDFPDLVQTSLNLGIIGTKEEGLNFTFLIRSSFASQKEMLVQRVRSIVEYAGGTVTEKSAYPGWQYVRNSALRERVLEAYRHVSGREGTVAGTHGGLECGLFVEKIPGLDVVSLGPNMRWVHSPREQLSVASTDLNYRLVCEILKRSQ